MSQFSLSKRIFTLAALVCALAISSVANASLITTHTGYSGPALDLSAYETGNYGFTFGPSPIPGMVFTRDPNTASNSGLGGVLGQGGYGLVDNGSFGGDAVYAGLDGREGWMRFMLTGGPVSEFGAYVNYAPGFGPSPVIRVLAADLSVLEEYDLGALAPISTPGGFNEFQFRGISRSSADIYGLELANSYILATGTDTGVVLPVPDAGSTMLLFGLGLAGVRALRKRVG